MSPFIFCLCELQMESFEEVVANIYFINGVNIIFIKNVYRGYDH
jgi:hypothetical protein